VSAERRLRILLSARAAQQLRGPIAKLLDGRPHVLVEPGQPEGVDVAFVSRDVTGLSTKHELQPATRSFYDTLEQSGDLRWVHVHSAGADRPVYLRLRQRGVQVTTSSGTNAAVVAQTAVAAVLALGRRFPQLMRAQRERRWAPLIGSTLPRDIQGQHAVVVGWGPIGQEIGRLLLALGLRLTVVRHGATPAGAAIHTVPYQDLHQVLPTADWLLLACPLSEITRGLVDAGAIERLPAGAHLVNVARGEVVDEQALIAALQSGRLAGAFLDVFAHEPLPPESPLWSMDNVIATPHSAGFSDGNETRVARLFLDNLGRWLDGTPLVNVAGEASPAS